MFISFSSADEPKLNQSWEDPLPHRTTPTSVVNFTGTPIARRSDVASLLAPNRHINNNILAAPKQQQKSTSLNLGKRETQTLQQQQQQQTPSSQLQQQHHQGIRKRLEHTPSARTVSSEESWCSEGVASDRELSSDDEDDSQLSDRSITSSTPRNSQLRLTFNKAKQHLSFDKWRNSNSANNNNSVLITPTGNQSLSNSTATTNSSASSTPTSTVAGMPSANNESPSSEPFSRLSRWFSIRRGSTHQYDVDKGRENRAASAEPDMTDSAMSKTSTISSNKMPQLTEVRLQFLTFV